MYISIVLEAEPRRQGPRAPLQGTKALSETEGPGDGGETWRPGGNMEDEITCLLYMYILRWIYIRLDIYIYYACVCVCACN